MKQMRLFKFGILIFAIHLTLSDVFANPAVNRQIKTMVSGIEEGEHITVAGVRLYSSVVLPRFYQNRNYVAAWTVQDRGLRAVKMINAIQQASFEGLNPDDYHFEVINKLQMSLKSVDNAKKRAELDILLTDAYLLYASHLYNGKTDPERIGAAWNIQRSSPELMLDEKLEEAIQQNRIYNSLHDLRPQVTSYRQLRSTLRHYNQNLIMREWVAFSISENIRPGTRNELTEEIRQRLILLKDLRPYVYTDSLYYDDRLEVAVKHFQKRHGMNPDGVIGRRTIEALNITPVQRMQIVKANMERLRWLPNTIEDEHIMVNIANFQMDYILAKDTLVSSRAIVGRHYRKTPVFKAKMDHLVFSPTWTVPPGILRNDIIPAVKNNPNYLTEKNMRILDRQGNQISSSSIDWSAYPGRTFPYTIRQDPGPQNALGKVKFMFPNSYNVYIHDTPTRNLFAQDIRTFSSGCIRIEKAFELSLAILRDYPGWNTDRIITAMNSTREQRVNLNNKIAVYMTYFTAWSDGEKLNFRTDVYDRDMALINALLEKAD